VTVVCDVGDMADLERDLDLVTFLFLTVVYFSGVFEGVGDKLNFLEMLVVFVFLTLLKILGVFLLGLPVLKVGTEMVSIFRLQHSSISSFILLRLFKLF
jgi:hypothetical protein